MESQMTKVMYLVLGLLVLSGTMLMVTAAPDGARGNSRFEQASMDIRALERSIDLKSLPTGDLDPAIYQ
jgi:hypothetical protein